MLLEGREELGEAARLEPGLHVDLVRVRVGVRVRVRVRLVESGLLRVRFRVRVRVRVGVRVRVRVRVRVSSRRGPVRVTARRWRYRSRA